MGTLSSGLFVVLIIDLEMLLWSCSAKNIAANFVFGDSLVDAGNNNYLLTSSRADYPPNGIDLGRPTGRYTNGRTIVDIITQELGYEDFTPPYLAPTTVGPVILQGVNYASGGSGILNDTGNIFGARLNLDVQLDNFANTRQQIIAMISAPAAETLIRTALFSVTVGSNDFLNNYFTPVLSTAKRVLLPPDVFTTAMICKFRQQLTRLYNLGARKIVVVNVGPIGCIPFQRDTNPAAGANCVGLPNQMAQLFNDQVKSLVSELSASLSGSKFIYANIYGIVADIIQNYLTYGFENANSACCYAAGNFGGLIPCGPSSMICTDRSKYLFWDPYHPTEAAYTIMAKRLLDGGGNDIFPINIRQLFNS